MGELKANGYVGWYRRGISLTGERDELAPYIAMEDIDRALDEEGYMQSRKTVRPSPTFMQITHYRVPPLLQSVALEVRHNNPSTSTDGQGPSHPQTGEGAAKRARMEHETGMTGKPNAKDMRRLLGIYPLAPPNSPSRRDGVRLAEKLVEPPRSCPPPAGGSAGGNSTAAPAPAVHEAMGGTTAAAPATHGAAPRDAVQVPDVSSAAKSVGAVDAAELDELLAVGGKT